MSENNDTNSTEDYLNISTDPGTVQVTYRHIEFEVKALYSASGVWTAYIKSDAIRADIFPNPPTFPTRSQALTTMIQSAMASLDLVLDQSEALLTQLGRGQPVRFHEGDPVAELVRTMAEGILASDELDQSSLILQRFRQAFEQSQE